MSPSAPTERTTADPIPPSAGGAAPRQIVARTLVALAIAAVVPPLLARPAAAQAPRLGAGRVAAQVATGTLGGAVGFVAGGLLTRSVVRHHGLDEESASHPAFLGALVGMTLLTPVGPAVVGNHQGAGSYLAAQGGALAGGLASALLIAGGRSGILDCRICGPLRIASGVAIALLPSIGATIGYDVTRSR